MTKHKAPLPGSHDTARTIVFNRPIPAHDVPGRARLNGAEMFDVSRAQPFRLRVEQPALTSDRRSMAHDLSVSLLSVVTDKHGNRYGIVQATGIWGRHGSGVLVSRLPNEQEPDRNAEPVGMLRPGRVLRVGAEQDGEGIAIGLVESALGQQVEVANRGGGVVNVLAAPSAEMSAHDGYGPAGHIRTNLWAPDTEHVRGALSSLRIPAGMIAPPAAA